MTPLTRWQRPLGTDRPAFAELTPRQADVLTCLCDGITSYEGIARRLYVGVSTVKKHVKGILASLNADDRAHAIQLALTGRVIVFVRGNYTQEIAA